MDDSKTSSPCFRETIEVDLSDYIDLKIDRKYNPLKETYEKSEDGLNQKAEELDKRITATYATLQEVTQKLADLDEKHNRKLESSLVRVYLFIFFILSILVGLISGIIGYLLNK